MADSSKVKEEAIHLLLALCEEKGVVVPDEIKNKLLLKGSATAGIEVDIDALRTSLTASAIHRYETKKKQNKEDIRRSENAKQSKDVEIDCDAPPKSAGAILADDNAKEKQEEADILADVLKIFEQVGASFNEQELVIQNGAYTITNAGVDDTKEKVTENGAVKPQPSTFWTCTPCYCLYEAIDGMVRRKGKKLESQQAPILQDLNLRFESGKTYLLLGAPGAGKSTLLRMIADTLTKDKSHVQEGIVSLNGVSPDGDVVWSNLVSYVDQIDRLFGRLTVKETCDFSWNCRTGGTHATDEIQETPEVAAVWKDMDEKDFLVNKVLELVGLANVKDTFVGDKTIRGVSGGQKKRVVVSEMSVLGCPIECCDEISTGLDAATTYDITKSLVRTSRLTGSIRIVSLLQPPPETVALFDEVILLNKGQVAYSGPVTEVVDYFESLGYTLPDRWAVADWLQALMSKDGKDFIVGEHEHYTAEEFKERFYSSERGRALLETVNAPTNSKGVPESAKKRYHVPWYKSLKYVVGRELLLWWRDKTSILTRLAADIVFGVIAGTVFWQANDEPMTVVSVLFQALMFLAMSSMGKIPAQFTARSVFYKEQDANLYPTWTYIVGRTIAEVPGAFIDAICFGTIMYWFVGLAFNEGASIVNYFLYLLIILLASFVGTLFFGIFSALFPNADIANGMMGVAVVIMMLFSGFTVSPDIIPVYWTWVYWINLFAWLLRALVVNEYQSGKYDGRELDGNQILENFGFSHNGEAFTFEWLWWGILFALGYGLICAVLATFGLSKVRFETGKTVGTGGTDEDEQVESGKEQVEEVEIPFQRATLSFRDIHYYVKASTSREKLELLGGVDGVIEAGKMTALMGSSGAGKTTLMDVLALRKSGGEITGDVYLNGHKQEPNSFRRCTGYVEQFDVQSPQLTIREAMEFSAKTRLSGPNVNAETIKRFVDQTLAMVELTPVQHLQVGNDEMGGISFEQKKRTSIAVEVVANPSILFLDEPTSGLDARAASIVMRGMKRIALSGRAVCATIHQPSIAIFNDFDSLLLLRKGGEVVYHGDLGHESCKLIEYYEQYEATTKIQPGENPATWMLTSIGAGSSSAGVTFDYGAAYAVSSLHEECLRKIDQLCEDATDENEISYPTKYATSENFQQLSLLKRTMLLYWRNPGYNSSRMVVAILLALIFGSVYVTNRVPATESDMRSRVTTIFLGAMLLANTAFSAVLEVFEFERNMFYRHRDAQMYSERAVLLSFTVAELPFIFIQSMIFQVIFYFMVGFNSDPEKFFLFYLFLTLNLIVWTMLGQMLVALMKTADIASVVGSVLGAVNSLFTGVLIAPALIPQFWIFLYWGLPGHYIIEGLVMSQFRGDTTPIEASPGTFFWEGNNCTAKVMEDPDHVCMGEAGQWIEMAFGSFFSYDHIPWNVLYCAGVVIIARAVTWIALWKLNYRST